MSYNIKQKANKRINMPKKRKGIITLLAVALAAGMSFGLAGCATGSSKADLKNSVSYNGIDYVVQEDIGLNFAGFKEFNEGIGELGEKVGTLRQADVYKIKGLDQSEWIFLDNKSMLSSNAPYGGIYRSSRVKMDTIADFKPDHLDIYYLSPPTNGQSGSQEQIFSTEDLNIIDKIISAIENGSAVPSDKQAEVAKAIRNGDGSYRNYRLEFLSQSYPKLVYRLNYTEDATGKFYVGFCGDITEYKIVEIDNTLHELVTVNKY